MKQRTVVVASVGVLLAAATLSGCSSAEEAASVPASAIGAASQAAADTEMVALCTQMVADGLSPEEATAVAEEAGYVARVGSIDGEPQAVTMDFREDRFTFEVADGAVVGCTYG